mmetsp:Transcript_19677/g.29378  ORF Transcript_19677/g.29378 Transcript_19677/m.29378 type:complete len:292 (-) Transcript_19677:148-1023(-)
MASGLSVKQIKEILDKAGVDYSDCFEKKDLEKRLEQTRAKARKKSSFSSGDSQIPKTEQKQRRSPPTASRGSSSNGHGDMKDIDNLIKRINGMEDYYEILGVDREATDVELKKAYRKLALKLHPDKCQEEGSEDAFKKVGAAYHCLSDPEKRQRYNLMGPASENGGMAQGQHPDVDEIFRQFFGGGMGAGGMHGGPGFRFHFGGPGMFFHNMNAQNRGQRAQENDEERGGNPLAGLMPFAPILIMMLLNIVPHIIPILFSRGLLLLPLIFILPPHLRRPALIMFIMVAFFT